jgi:hypothetical protein
MDGSGYGENKKKYCPGCFIGIPTLGVVDFDFALSMMNLQFPMNWSGMTHVAKGLAVDAARNKLVEIALKEGYEWLFFRDDDVIAPPDALIKLYALKTPISAGVVWAKQFPTQPMIFKKGVHGGYMDWKRGDVFEADWTGMGCTLIHTSVFRQMEPPWFKTDFGSLADDEAGDPYLQAHTEDFYFCDKAAKIGYKPIVDTNVQCIHLDVSTGKKYLFHDELNTPAMLLPGGDVWVYPSVQERKEQNILIYPENVPEVVRFNLGCGPVKREGYINVDLHDPLADEKGDCRKLRWLTRKYGLADEIASTHLLEHFRPEEIPGILKEWVDCLKPGGLLHIIVPDFEQACRDFLDAPEDDPAKYHWKMYVMFGAPWGEGMSHQCGVTVGSLMKMTDGLPLRPMDIVTTPAGTPIAGEPGQFVRTAEIELRATKRGDSVSGTSLLTSDPDTKSKIKDAKSQMEVLLADRSAGDRECGEPAQEVSGDMPEPCEQVQAEADTQD